LRSTGKRPVVVLASMAPAAGVGKARVGDVDRLVDPDVLDLGAVEVALQRPEPGDPVEDVADDGLRVTDRRQRRGERPLRVVGHHVPDEHSARLRDRRDHPFRCRSIEGHTQPNRDIRDVDDACSASTMRPAARPSRMLDRAIAGGRLPG
jgi:hypothetical protein